MRITPQMVRATEVVGKAGGWFGVSACVLIMLLVTANVVSRFLWESIPGTLEITQALMVVLTAMLLAYTQARRGHVSVEFVVDRLPARVQKALGLLTLLLALGFIVLLVWQGWNMGWDGWVVKDHSSSPPYVPYYPAKLVFAIGVSLFCFQLIVDTWREIANFLTKEKSDAASIK